MKFRVQSLLLTLSDPKYLRKLTIRGGGALKAPSIPTISKTIGSIVIISCMCICQVFYIFSSLNFSKIYYFDLFKIKSSENRCKGNIFVILSEMDIKYINFGSKMAEVAKKYVNAIILNSL